MLIPNKLKGSLLFNVSQTSVMLTTVPLKENKKEGVKSLPSIKLPNIDLSNPIKKASFIP